MTRFELRRSEGANRTPSSGVFVSASSDERANAASMTARTAALAILLTACSRAPTAVRSGDAAPPADPVAPAIAAPVAPPPSGGATVPGLTITTLGEGRLELSTEATVSLARDVRIEERGPDGAWRPATLDSASPYRLTEYCSDGTATSPCATLTRDASLRPAAWPGLRCRVQCNRCEMDRPAGPGTFRFVVRACEGDAELASPPFDLPGASGTNDRALVRRSAVTGLLRGAAMRLDQRPRDHEAPPSDGMVARRFTRAGTERALTADHLSTFAALLHEANNFDDGIEKRCLTKELVGLRLVRSLPSTAGAREIVQEASLDFGCRRLFLSRREGSRWIDEHYAYFDPSDAAFTAFAKAVLPGDAELSKLRPEGARAP